jgi:acetyltransferase
MAATIEALPGRQCFAAIVPGPADGLAAIARRTGVRLLGPRSFGLAIPGLGLNATRAHMPPPAGRIALVSQSAALCRSVIDWAGPNGVGFSHIVGIGGNADLGFGMVLDWLSRDPGTGSILLDIRLLKNRRAFLSAARAAARLRPVVAMRAGGRLLDPAGAAETTFEAALRRAGVLSVAGLEDLLAAAETLSRARPARGEALAIVTNAIGPGRLAADAVLRHGLPLHAGEADERGLVHIPLDRADRFAAEAIRIGNQPEAGGVLVVHAPSGPQDEAIVAALIEASRQVRGPLLVCAMGETTGAVHRRALAQAGLAVFATPDQAVQGFQHLVQDRRNRAAARELPASTVLALAPDRPVVHRVFDQVRQAGRLALSQDEALHVLAAYGVPVVPTRAVDSPETTVDAAALLGFPAVVKLRQSVPPHDRARGGLALDLHDAGEVRGAARLMLARAQRQQAESAGLLVQRQAARARELAIRVADDAVFGPVIAFGPGGAAAEIDSAWALDLPPLNLPLARGLIARSRPGPTLGVATRDLPPAQEGAVAEALVRISQLIVDFPAIAALAVTSLFADETGVLAADAWLRLRAERDPPSSLAIAPYPVELVEHWSANGERFTVRPIRPEDAEQHGAFFRRLAPVDIRYRFFTTMRELSPEQMARLTQVDYDREMAFIAVREATGETVGVARLVSEADGGSAEFAVIVQPDVKHRGVATHLMQRLTAWGRGRGLHEIVGQVLAENVPMLAFVRHLGFTLRRLPEEPDVIEARLGL